MEALPIELLSQIAGYLDLGDKKSLRLTSSKLCNAPTRALFHTMSLYPDENSSRARAFENVAATHLARHVRRIRIHTQQPNTPSALEHSLGGNRSAEDNDEHGSSSSQPGRELNSSFPVLWEAVRVLQFPFLRSLSVSFDPRWWIPYPYWNAYAIEDDNLYDSGLPRESFETRVEVLQRVFDYTSSEHGQSVRELTIKNLQNTNHGDVVNNEPFKMLLGRLRSLRLFILHNIDDDGLIGTDMNVLYHVHEFFAELRPVWIEPAKTQLTRLALYADTFWGFVPKVDFRGLCLPHLRVLELGKWCISHDWQIDWISSHAATLETLWMDDCTILTQTRSYVELDDEGYPLYSTSRMGHSLASTGQPFRFYEYNRRWAYIFDRFRTDIPLLCDFRFGSTFWHDSNSDELEQIVRQLPHDVNADGVLMGTKWYHAFINGIDGEETGPWVPELDEQYGRQRYPHDPPFVPYPGFSEEDKEALVALLKKVKQPIPQDCHNLQGPIESRTG